METASILIRGCKEKLDTYTLLFNFFVLLIAFLYLCCQNLYTVFSINARTVCTSLLQAICPCEISHKCILIFVDYLPNLSTT